MGSIAGDVERRREGRARLRRGDGFGLDGGCGEVEEVLDEGVERERGRRRGLRRERKRRGVELQGRIRGRRRPARRGWVHRPVREEGSFHLTRPRELRAGKLWGRGQELTDRSGGG